MGVRVPPSALHILAGQNPQRLKHARVLESSDSHANSHARKKLTVFPVIHHWVSLVTSNFQTIGFSQKRENWDTPTHKDDVTMDQLHTLKDIGTILNVSRSTVYRLIDRGDILVIDVGGCKRITETALKKFIKDRERAAKLGLS